MTQISGDRRLSYFKAINNVQSELIINQSLKVGYNQVLKNDFLQEPDDRSSWDLRKLYNISKRTGETPSFLWQICNAVPL